MTSPAFEAFLARIYVEAGVREAFLADPVETARAAGLSDAEIDAVVAIDRDGLRLVAESLARRGSESC